MVKVSVILPVYNVEEYLEECLTSVVNQSLKEIEIICINDGSTDHSLQILQKFGAQDSRIRIISKKNSGYGHSVNLGIDNAIGQYISIVETDDFVDSTMLEELYEIALQYDLDMIKADSRVFISRDGEYEYVHRSVLPDDIKELYHKVINCYLDIRVFQGYVYTWAGIYKREFLNRHNIRHNESPGASYQDNGFWFQTTMYAEKMYFLKRAYYNLRRDNPNSSIYSKEKVFCICEEYDFIRNKVSLSNVKIKQELLYQVFYYRFLNYITTIQRIDNQYRAAFFERMKIDIIAALNSGEIDGLLFTSEQWDYMYTIMKGLPVSLFEYDRLARKTKKLLQKASAIWIYGAGKWGLKTLDFLNRNGLEDKTKGFIVSDKTFNPRTICGLNVYSLDELNNDDDILVIIAVSNRYIIEIQKNLINRDYRNILLCEDLLT